MRVITLTFILLISACSSQRALEYQTQSQVPIIGEPIALTPINDYQKLTLKFMIWTQGLSDEFPISQGMDLYRLTFWADDGYGQPEQASGLIAVPKEQSSFPGIVSWQHGTASLKTAAPSNGDLFNGVLPAAVFAGGSGYLLFAPDYAGFGQSADDHSYYVTPTIVGSIAPMLNAGREVLQQNGLQVPVDIYLTGFSQGAHASLATQRYLEQRGNRSIRATAVIAGAVDLREEGLHGALNGGSRFASLYIAWIAVSYAREYNLPITDLLTSPWDSVAPALFDGENDGDTIIATLPADPADLFSDDLMKAYENHQSHWFFDRLTENGLLDWQPQAPVRIYYGNSDTDVTPKQALLFAEHAQDGDVEAISVGDLDHEASVLPGAVLIRDYFNSLSQRENP